jgi:2Fe-2S ferredoxin
LVNIHPGGRSVRVLSGTRIFDAARQAGMPLASSCGARGLCARCGVVILAGAAAVSSETSREARAKRANRIDPAQRLSCMTTIEGDVEISTPYW